MMETVLQPRRPAEKKIYKTSMTINEYMMDLFQGGAAEYLNTTVNRGIFNMNENQSPAKKIYMQPQMARALQQNLCDSVQNSSNVQMTVYHPAIKTAFYKGLQIVETPHVESNQIILSSEAVETATQAVRRFGEGMDYASMMMGNFADEIERTPGVIGGTFTNGTVGPENIVQAFDAAEAGYVNRQAMELARRDVLQLRIRDNLRVSIKTRVRNFAKISKEEETAIETLREMIPEKDFRKYVKDGFIVVQGKSGKLYQIFRDKAHTKVWQNGRIVEEVCVRIADKSIPLTDNVIAFRMMILTNEDEFRKAGNVYRMAA